MSKKNRDMTGSVFSPEMLAALENAQKISSALPPETLRDVAKIQQSATSGITLKDLARVTEQMRDAKTMAAISQSAEIASKVRLPDIVTQSVGSTVAAEAKATSPPKKKRQYVMDDPEMMEEYFGVKEPTDFKEAITCLKRLEEVQQIRDELAHSKTDKITYRDMEIDSDDLYELNGVIKRLTEYLESFRKRMPDYDVGRVARNLDYLCARYRITRNQLEKILGVSQGYFARVLNPSDAKRRMSVEIMNNVCKLFNVSVDRFLSDELSRTMMTGISKAFRFMDNLIDMTLQYKMHWDETAPIMKTGMHMAERLSLKGMSSSDPVKKTDYWRAETPAGDTHLVYMITESGKKGYKVGISGEENIRWIFETKSDVSGDLYKKCERLHQIIDEQKDEFYLSYEASQAIDDFMDAFDNIAKNEGRMEYIEEQLESYREELHEKSLDWQAEEFQRRYEIEAERLESSEIEFDDGQLRKEIEEAVSKEAEEEIDAKIEEEREKMMREVK